MDVLHIVDLEAAINHWRARAPSQAGAALAPEVAALAEVYARMAIAQRQTLEVAALSDAANAQPWDPSIKSLTMFPNVLGQMASNLPWTTALGKAYYNDPADVMNAIQVMRGRAYKAVWRSHRLHHFKNEHYWFSVTTSGTSDRVLGTYPDPATVETSPTAKNLHGSVN